MAVFRCEICNGSYDLWKGKPIYDHSGCAEERAERVKDRAFLRMLRQQAPDVSEADDLLYDAFALIANANEGDWDAATPEWKAAAERWRDRWHSQLSDRKEHQ